MFCVSLDLALSVSEVCDSENYQPWFRLEIRHNAFRWSTIPQNNSSSVLSVSFFQNLQILQIHFSFFISNQCQASALKVDCIFKDFGAQSCLMVAQKVDQVTYVYEEYNNCQDSISIFMISDFKMFCIMLLRLLNYGRFNSRFTFITKEKLHLSLICSYYCFLVKRN